MDYKEIKKKVEVVLQHSMNGHFVESLKIQFIKSWYDLTENHGINEFIKDTSAIANTFGLDGFIIIGYDENAKAFYPSKFVDSGLTNQEEVQRLIIKKCSDFFDVHIYDLEILSSSISVVHIPAYKHKPIVVPYYEKKLENGELFIEHQKIFVRKNSETAYANKTDIDIMYYDRKNTANDYQYHIEFLQVERESEQTGFPPDIEVFNNASVRFIIENVGERTLLIKKAEVLFETDFGELTLLATHIKNPRGKIMPVRSIIKSIDQNSHCELELKFAERESKRKLEKERILQVAIILTLVGGKKLVQKR